MRPADRGSVPSTFRAFVPFLVSTGIILVALGVFLHASLSRQAKLTFAVSIEGVPAYRYTATSNGKSFSSGMPSGLGYKTLHIESEECEPFTTNVFVWYGGRNLGTIKLPIARRSLSLKVMPNRNTVSIKGERFQFQRADCGETNLVVPVGTYEVEAVFAHCRVEQRVTVGRGGAAIVSIQPKLTTVNLSANPPDAHFTLEATAPFPISLAGATPTVITDVPAGTYDLNIRRGKYEKKLSVNLTADPTNELSVTFDYGSVSFASEPSGAEIRNGDQSLGTTPATVSLIPGSYRFVLNKEGFFPKEAACEVKENETKHLAFTLSNIAFANAFKNAESALNSFSPDYATAYGEITKALEIQPNDHSAQDLRSEILFRQSLAKARELSGANDIDDALKMVADALARKPDDLNALNLKRDLEQRKRAVLARAAEDRRQRPRKLFTEVESGIKHHELFDTQRLTVRCTRAKALGALHRAFSSGKPTWTTFADRTLNDDVSVFDAHTSSFGSKQRVVFLVGQVTDDTCEIFFKLWQYTLSNNVQIINGKMTEESWSPVHPSYSSWAAEVVNQRRKRDIEAIRQKFEAELNSQ